MSRLQRKQPDETVTFRLHETYLTRLVEAAREAASESHHIEARRRVIQSLEDEGRTEAILSHISKLESDLASLKHDLALATRALLIASTNGKKISPEEAAKWVKDTLKSGS